MAITLEEAIIKITPKGEKKTQKAIDKTSKKLKKLPDTIDKFKKKTERLNKILNKSKFGSDRFKNLQREIKKTEKLQRRLERRGGGRGGFGGRGGRSGGGGGGGLLGGFKGLGITGGLITGAAAIAQGAQSRGVSAVTESTGKLLELRRLENINASLGKTFSKFDKSTKGFISELDRNKFMADMGKNLGAISSETTKLIADLSEYSPEIAAQVSAGDFSGLAGIDEQSRFLVEQINAGMTKVFGAVPVENLLQDALRGTKKRMEAGAIKGIKGVEADPSKGIKGVKGRRRVGGKTTSLQGKLKTIKDAELTRARSITNSITNQSFKGLVNAQMELAAQMDKVAIAIGSNNAVLLAAQGAVAGIETAAAGIGATVQSIKDGIAVITKWFGGTKKPVPVRETNKPLDKRSG